MDAKDATAALQAIAVGVGEVGAEMAKSFDEITTKLGELAAGGTTPEQDAIIASITSGLASAKATAQKLDDIVPDVATGPTGENTLPVGEGNPPAGDGTAAG